MLQINESDLRKLIREEIEQSIEEMKTGIHDPRAAEMVSQEKQGQSQNVLQAVDAVLSQFQAIHAGQESRQAASKARKSAKTIYEFVKGKENRTAQGIFPPNEVIAMARGLASNPEKTVEKYVRPLLSLKKKMASVNI